MAPAIQSIETVPEDDHRLHVGRVIGGKYRLDRPLGVGGMGVVWCATHLELDAPVAIKLLATGERPSSKLVETFLHEAQAAASVRHRNVVSTMDFGTDVDGQPFMVMELLEGANLASRFGDCAWPDVTELVDLMAQCLSGLAAVHAAGLQHRDLKPENVFLVTDGDGTYPKLIDFGISRSLHEPPTEPAHSGARRRGAMLTNDGLMMGTPHYMSPEQARGLADIDQRADLYAVGVMLYEGLAGHPPYDLPNVVELLGAIARGGAPPLVTLRPDVGVALSDVVARAMAGREDRYSDAREMRAALLGATSLTRGTTPPHGAPVPPRVLVETIDALLLPTHGRRAKVVAVALCALALSIGAGIWAATSPGSASPAQAATHAVVPRHAGAVGRSATRTKTSVAPVVVAHVAVDAAAAPMTAVVAPPVRHRAIAPVRHARSGGLVDGVFRDPGF